MERIWLKVMRYEFGENGVNEEDLYVNDKIGDGRDTFDDRLLLAEEEYL
jgi:hypothetical protein